jgi:hypothetical protein
MTEQHASEKRWSPVDDGERTDDCTCTYTPYDDGDTDSVHYLRRWWYSLHCPHDGVQGQCAACGARAPQWGSV